MHVRNIVTTLLAATALAGPLRAQQFSQAAPPVELFSNGYRIGIPGAPLITAPAAGSSMTVTQGPQAAQQSGNEWYFQDVLTRAGIGNPSDPAATGNGSIIAVLKQLRVLLGNPLAVTGTFWQQTQPISAAALPLPAGAATAANQAPLAAPGTPAASATTVTTVPAQSTYVRCNISVPVQGSGAVLACPAGSLKAGAEVQNTGSADVYLSLVGTATTADQRLVAGGTYIARAPTANGLSVLNTSASTATTIAGQAW